jgi:type I restriction enzyme M protein
MGQGGPLELRRRRNSLEILGEGAKYARECLFGIDIDPELVRAARMNMLINNDGHGNIVEANSLQLSPRAIAENAIPRAEQLAFESFDVVLTNPPF